MGDINPFTKYLIKDKKEDIFHSTAYAKAQSGAAMGAVSAQGFAERQKMEQNRQVIQGYGASRIANSSIGSGPRAKTFTPPAPAGGTPAGAGSSVAVRPGVGVPSGGAVRPGGVPRPSMPKPLGLSGKR